MQGAVNQPAGVWPAAGREPPTGFRIGFKDIQLGAGRPSPIMYLLTAHQTTRPRRQGLLCWGLELLPAAGWSLLCERIQR